MKRGYQYNFSQIHQPEMYDEKTRQKKAITIIAVLSTFFAGQKLQDLTVLDVGSSTGLIDYYLADHFKQLIGIDIDETAVVYAQQHLKHSTLQFQLGDAMNLAFPDDHFDLVICAQIYEHVPDARQMMAEIHRVLKPNGICYFAATNRFKIQEAHYHLPFLSVIPRFLAHLYLRLAKKGRFYYEQHLSYWGLKKLVKAYHCIDFTAQMLHNPEKYHISYLLKPHSSQHRIAQFVVDHLYSLSPGYIWLLQKK